MWLYRRILRISRMSRQSYQRGSAGKNGEGTTVKRRKLEYPGRIMENDPKYRLLKSKLQGKVLRERGHGRRRISWLKNLKTPIFKNNQRPV
jgi:hypothetical protein